MKLFRSFLMFVLMAAGGAHAQTPSASEDVHALLAQHRWEDVVRLAEASPHRYPEIEYCYGMALARLQRWDEAASAFRRGAKQAPTDKRFPLELAGVAFQQKQYAGAASELRRAMRLDPTDAYAKDFLGTVYFLDDNLPAALKYWNRVGKPVLAEVSAEPLPRLAPVLLDRTFAFSPGSILQPDQVQVTRERLDLLGVFPRYRLELLPKDNGDFALLFRASERNGWGDTKLQGFIGLLRNLPYQTINPEFFNLGGKGANLVSAFRWDRNKQRVTSSFFAPVRGDTRWQYRLNADIRKERWELTTGAQPFMLRKAEAGAQIRSVPRAGWSWMAGLALSQRRFRDLGVDPAVAMFLKDGWELKYLGQVDRQLLSIPERRFTTSATATMQFGTLWAAHRASFAKATAGLKASWLPTARGDDYATSAQLRWGRAFGQVPFDEFFQLGIERDNDLWMHAHPGTADGRKGSAPLGSDFLLFNWELDKNIRRSAFFSVSLGPALDVGKMFGGAPQLGSRQWLCDVAIQAKVRLFGGVGVVLSYGKDLRTGRNVFYPAGVTAESGIR